MDLGLEQKDVAKIIGVTESSIWNWEHGWNIQNSILGDLQV